MPGKTQEKSLQFFPPNYHESFPHYWKLITEINALTGYNYQWLWRQHGPKPVTILSAILSRLHMIGLQTTCSRFPVESAELQESLFIYR